MGAMLFIANISDDLFDTFNKWFGKLRGGLSIATISASAIFAAASGSSLATTGTIGMIASKEMVRANYNKPFASGSIIAGGTLGALLPPSTLLILYGMMTEESIGKLLMAGIIPGIILALLFILTAMVIVWIKPQYAPVDSYQVSWKERFVSLKGTIWILLLIVVLIGGMYIGVFNAIEAGGIGAFLTILLAIFKRKLTFKLFIDALSKTLVTTGFLFAIIITAFILNYFLVITKLPIILADFVHSLDVPNWVIFAVMVLVYLLLGCVMESLAMIVVTIPIFLPIIISMGYDPIWFGVFIVVIEELSLIHPPFGLNCFVLKGVAPEFTLNQIYVGSLYYIIPIFVLLILLYLMPEIALFMPNRML